MGNIFSVPILDKLFRLLAQKKKKKKKAHRLLPIFSNVVEIHFDDISYTCYKLLVQAFGKRSAQENVWT
jgi:hypothetical protein